MTHSLPHRRMLEKTLAVAFLASGFHCSAQSGGNQAAPPAPIPPQSISEQSQNEAPSLHLQSGHSHGDRRSRRPRQRRQSGPRPHRQRSTSLRNDRRFERPDRESPARENCFTPSRDRAPRPAPRQFQRNCPGLAAQIILRTHRGLRTLLLPFTREPQGRSAPHLRHQFPKRSDNIFSARLQNRGRQTCGSESRRTDRQESRRTSKGPADPRSRTQKASRT